MNDLVSIIVPVYNVEKYLEKCLKTILRQTYDNIEIILINDGSTDKSKQICEKFAKKDSRIVLINQENKGVSYARNVGIKKARGKYITFVDSDDWVENEFIETLYNNIKEEQVDVVRCQYYKNTDTEQVSVEEQSFSKSYSSKEIKKEIIPDLITGKRMAYIYLLLIKKEIVNKVNKFNEKLYVMEDTSFYIDLLFTVKNIKIIDEKLYHHYQNSNSLILSPINIERNMKNILEVNKYMREILAKHKEEKFIKILDIHHFVIIINHILKFYRAKYSNKDIEKCIKSINETKYFKEMCNKIDKRKVKVQYKIALKLLEKGNYKLLLLLWKVIYLLKG